MDCQDLIDRFASQAMRVVPWTYSEPAHDHLSADRCWQIAIAMKQARDRIFTTAQAVDEPIPPFPKLDMEET